MRILSNTAIACTAALAIALMATASAQPPAHAPAHGYRAKQKGQSNFVSHSGVAWELDYGIKSGNCDRRAISAALGGIAGALIANRVAEDDNRTVATLIGAAAGAFIGNRIGKNIDKTDEACIGHALELGESGQAINWTNEDTGVNYQVVPGETRNRDGATCREFTFTAVTGSEKSSRRGLGCESEPGAWQIIQ